MINLEDYTARTLIDKSLIHDFFVDDPPSDQAIHAVKRTIVTVILKHFNMYATSDILEDLIGEALTALYERKSRGDFDPTVPPSSQFAYVYQVSRNIIGEFIRKHTRELIVDEVLPLSNASTSPDDSQVSLVAVPPEIRKFMSALTGQRDYITLPITHADAINLSMFFLAHSNQRPCRVPEFISDDPNALAHLYKLAIS